MHDNLCTFLLPFLQNPQLFFPCHLLCLWDLSLKFFFDFICFSFPTIFPFVFIFPFVNSTIMSWKDFIFHSAVCTFLIFIKALIPLLGPWTHPECFLIITFLKPSSCASGNCSPQVLFQEGFLLQKETYHIGFSFVFALRSRHLELECLKWFLL